MATPFELSPFGVELALCQRYYEKSFDLNTAPTPQNTTGQLILNTSYSTNANSLLGTVIYKVTKRINGGLTLYNPYSNSTTTLRIPNGSTDRTIAAISAFSTGATITMTDPGNVPYSYHYQYSVDAEL